ncbi:MAG: hypothetical protein R3E87_25105 [Burkholderiaceae bacterium]
MSTHAAQMESAALDMAANSAQQAGHSVRHWFKSVFARMAAGRQAALMAHLEAIDPRLAREMRAARDRADW